MNRTALVSTLAAGALAASLAAAVGPAGASTSSAHKLGKQDASFLKANDQSNLAEVTLGHYIENNFARYQNARKFAVRVGRDHTRLEKTVKGLAGQYRVSLPATPNATQLAGAKRTMTAKNKAYTYFEVEIMGHQKAIATAEQEIAKGSNPAVVGYAKTYVPIATGHLKKAESNLNYLKSH